MTRILLAAVLAAAICLLIGVILGRSDDRATATWDAWRESSDVDYV